MPCTTRGGSIHDGILSHPHDPPDRCLQLPLLLLCSTDDALTRATWTRLGFVFTSPEDLQRFGVAKGDLLHMDNTVQVGTSKGSFQRLVACCDQPFGRPDSPANVLRHR